MLAGVPSIAFGLFGNAFFSKTLGLGFSILSGGLTPALSLSGGQQQRLCLARAIALQPEVLLMDEPCSALDPISGEVIEDLMLHLRKQYTLIVVTHNLAQARRIADQVAVFWVQDEIGRLIESGTTTQIFEYPQHSLTNAS
ncbi:MAG: hypothetical protein AUK48_00740 [Oscillatoriales cyanobacterium CG2_30_44_21]|nr:MAG: hypothetical protein AUK48_00740 [Oscillatoriales cyanobacterium CG2_30_44_21]